MPFGSIRTIKLLVAGLFLSATTSHIRGNNLEIIGIELLRTVDPSLQGAGVHVAHVESNLGGSPPAFEVNPSAVGQPASLFTYISGTGTATAYPNSVGFDSWHAIAVGNLFYGTTNGVAPMLSHVDNYEAGHFYQTFISTPLRPSIPARIVNQSFVLTSIQQQTVDQQYDNYAGQRNVLFVSGVGNGAVTGNGGFVNAPATCYNGIGVGAKDGPSSFGPTLDNGRSKPDLIAPGTATSWSTPLVSGGAAVLMQAGGRGDGGPATNDATDIRTIKALLLNGAIKPTNWSHTSTRPLDTNYGAGVLNVFNSYSQLTGGKQSFIESTTHSNDDLQLLGTNLNNIASLSGWDLANINSTVSQARVNHYYFELTNVASGGYTVTATLAWNRRLNESDVNDLNLFLYDLSGNLVAASTSSVDNVEHLYLPQVPPGRYDLQVWKRGGSGNSGTETYALAFEMFTMPLQIQQSGTNIALSWPLAPTGFRLQATTNLATPSIWSNVTGPVTVTNGLNVVTLPAANTIQAFRLIRP